MKIRERNKLLSLSREGGNFYFEYSFLRKQIKDFSNDIYIKNILMQKKTKLIVGTYNHTPTAGAGLKIYKASAGSGKTHTIVYEYLKMALDNEHIFQNILAVTFTNKVARELKHRVIDTIYNITQANFSPLAKELMIAKNWDEKEIISRSTTLLNNILQDYSSFHICTIDSFFQQVIDKFGIDLGLKSDFSIELDPTNTKKEVVSTTINKLKTNKNLKNWLIQLAEEKLREGKSWEIASDISILCSTLFNESKLITDKKLDPDFITNFIKKLNKEITDFESTAQGFGEKIMSIIKTQNLKVEDFAYGKTGIMGYIDNLSNKKISDPSKRVLGAAECLEAWTSKSSSKASEIKELVEKQLIGILHDFLFFNEKKSKLYKSCKIAKSFIHILGIKSQMQEEIDIYKKNHNIIFIPDATLLTHSVVNTHNSKEFSENLGQKYTNFFIDEFQDISFLQWKCFLPLIEDSIKNNNTNIIVGDVKQSIYRWRNSSWQLLHQTVAQEIENHEIITLQTNWRSRKNIVFFNNTFFPLASALITEEIQKNIDEIEEMELRNSLSLQVKSIKEVYSDSIQKLPNTALNKYDGYVQICLIQEEKENNLSWQDKAKTKTIDLIESLQEEGFNAKDIAVLVRNHKEGREIFEAIIQRSTSKEYKEYCNYSVVSASSFCLGHNIWINLIISTMRYIQNTKNSLAKYELSHFYNLCIQAQNQDLKMSYTIDEKKLQEIENLYSHPLHSLIDSLIDIFKIKDENAIPFINKLQDLILDFCKKNNNLRTFLQWWKEKGRTSVLPGSDNVDAIKILTIHQSKGLQFPAVIMPFCNWDFDHSSIHAPMLWCEENDSLFASSNNLDPVQNEEYSFFATVPALPMIYSSKMKDTVFSRSYYDEKMQSYLDNLNLLYVALTRAEERMYLFAQKSTNEGIKSISDLLHTTLLQNKLPKEEYQFPDWQNFWNDEKTLFTIGIKKEHEKSDKKNNSTPNKENRLMHYYSENKNESETKKNWIDLFKGQKNKINSSEIILGDLIHSLVSEIITLKNLPKALEKIEFMPISEEEKYTLKQILNQLSTNLEIKNWLDGSWQQKIESPLVNSYGKILRPDRVLFKEKKAIVLDFKTGLHSSSYIKQVKEYTEAIATMYSAEIEGYLVYLSEKEIRIELVV